MALRGCVNFYHTHRHKQDHLLNGLYRTPVIAPQCTSKNTNQAYEIALASKMRYIWHIMHGGEGRRKKMLKRALAELHVHFKLCFNCGGMPAQARSSRGIFSTVGI